MHYNSIKYLFFWINVLMNTEDAVTLTEVFWGERHESVHFPAGGPNYLTSLSDDSDLSFISHQLTFRLCLQSAFQRVPCSQGPRLASIYWLTWASGSPVWCSNGAGAQMMCKESINYDQGWFWRAGWVSMRGKTKRWRLHQPQWNKVLCPWFLCKYLWMSEF